MISTPKTTGLSKAAVAKQIAGSVQTALTAADGTSADRVQNLSLIQQARVSRLTRTAASVTAQYGATSGQASAAQAAVVAANTNVARTQMLHQQATTAAPQVAATGWALHGRVYDAQLKPVSGHTVFLVDSQKTYQEAYGFAYTDSTGYFLINFPGATPPPPSESTATVNETAPPSTPAADAPAQSSTEQLFVEIANTSAKPVHLSASAFQPVVGNATYQNITLLAGEPELGDPPEAIRKVALPPQK
jgi:hypothetical protein